MRNFYILLTLLSITSHISAKRALNKNLSYKNSVSVNTHALTTYIEKQNEGYSDSLKILNYTIDSLNHRINEVNEQLKSYTNVNGKNLNINKRTIRTYKLFNSCSVYFLTEEYVKKITKDNKISIAGKDLHPFDGYQYLGDNTYFGINSNNKLIIQLSTNVYHYGMNKNSKDIWVETNILSYPDDSLDRETSWEENSKEKYIKSRNVFFTKFNKELSTNPNFNYLNDNEKKDWLKRLTNLDDYYFILKSDSLKISLELRRFNELKSVYLNNLKKQELIEEQKKEVEAVNCESARKEYLEMNPDVKKVGMDPWTHYTFHGKSEGRIWPPCAKDLNGNFITNQDVKILDGNNLNRTFIYPNDYAEFERIYSSIDSSSKEKYLYDVINLGNKAINDKELIIIMAKFSLINFHILSKSDKITSETWTSHYNFLKTWINYERFEENFSSDNRAIIYYQTIYCGQKASQPITEFIRRVVNEFTSQNFYLGSEIYDNLAKSLRDFDENNSKELKLNTEVAVVKGISSSFLNFSKVLRGERYEFDESTDDWLRYSWYVCSKCNLLKGREAGDICNTDYSKHNFKFLCLEGSRHLKCTGCGLRITIKANTKPEFNYVCPGQKGAHHNWVDY